MATICHFWGIPVHLLRVSYANHGCQKPPRLLPVRARVDPFRVLSLAAAVHEGWQAYPKNVLPACAVQGKAIIFVRPRRRVLRNPAAYPPEQNEGLLPDSSILTKQQPPAVFLLPMPIRTANRSRPRADAPPRPVSGSGDFHTVILLAFPGHDEVRTWGSLNPPPTGKGQKRVPIGF